MKVSVVILSKTDSDQMFAMICNCINSLLNSETQYQFEIIVVESNCSFKDSGYNLPKNVNVIIPNKKFNFHEFLNIGIKKSTSSYIALCNNDLLFERNWFSEIMKISEKNNDIMSFSPTEKALHLKKGFEVGYKIMHHLKGWCVVMKKELIDKTGFLDEKFDLYYADNDYAMMLRKYNIKHALVGNSIVKHLEKQTSKYLLSNNKISNVVLNKYSIPDYLYEKQYDWVFQSEVNLSGFLKFYGKWGNPKILYRKNKIADFFIKNHLGFINKFFLNINND